MAVVEFANGWGLVSQFLEKFVIRLSHNMKISRGTPIMDCWSEGII